MTTDVNEVTISLFLNGWHTCRAQVFGLCESPLAMVHGVRGQEQLLTGAHSGTGILFLVRCYCTTPITLARDFCHVKPNCLARTSADNACGEGLSVPK